MKLLPFLAASLLAAAPAFPQLAPPNAQGVTMGHIHLNAADPAAATVFWTDLVGAQPYEHGSLKGVSVPGVVIWFTRKAPTGPSVGSSVDHIGFTVPNLQTYIDKFAKTPYNTIPSTAGGVQLMIDGPDGARIELTEDKASTVPIRFHHVHFDTPDPKAIQAWYLEKFGATRSTRAKWDSGEIPGANLTYGPAGATAPTAGRAIDHIGFEIAGLEAFCKKLAESGVKLDTPYRAMPQLGLSLAFLTDPWGTRIELTEGLAKKDGLAK
jgi:catechol 2,3-dioxygenase-like lactoylglutathione lyase family enzyme